MSIHHKRIKKAACGLLVVMLEDFRAKAAFLCREGNKLLIIALDAKSFGKHLANGKAAASKFPAYGNDKIICHPERPFQ
jgi:hypothetical protein